MKTNSGSSGVKQEGMKEQLEMCKMRYGQGGKKKPNLKTFFFLDPVKLRVNEFRSNLKSN